MRPLTLFALWLGLVALIAGCAGRQPCLNNEGVIDPVRGLVLVFDRCDGTMYLDVLPGFEGKAEGKNPDQNVPDIQPESNPKVES